MSVDLVQHLANVVARRGFNAALDATEPARSGTGTTQELDVGPLAGQSTMEDAVEMIAPASS